MSESIIDIRQYVALGLKWWWLIVAATVLGAAAGYVFASRQVPVFEAQATIMVGQSIQAAEPSSSDISMSQYLARTYAEIVTQPVFLERVAAGLGRPLEGGFSAILINNTQLLRIRAEASSPEMAAATADEVANQLIQMSPTALQNQTQSDSQRFVQRRLAGLQSKIEAGQSRLAELEGQLSGPRSAEEVKSLQDEINDMESLINDWETNYTQLLTLVEGNQSPNYLVVVQPAQANPIQTRPNVTRSILTGAIIGLVLVSTIVFLIEFLNDTIKSHDDLREILGVVPLGRIGKINGDQYRDRLVTARDLFSPNSEVYRMIRSNIQFMAIDQPITSLVVTSASPGEGKSVTTANLGVVMAQAGLNTIIIDTDLRRPTQHQIFGLDNNHGLTDLLRATKPNLSRYLKKTDTNNLYVIPSGTPPPNPAELLGSERMRRLLTKLSEWADVIICDSPPVLAAADAAIMSNRVDGLVLVVQAEKTRLGAAQEALETLQQAGANILGAVLNRTKPQQGRYHYYHKPYAPRIPSENGHHKPTSDFNKTKRVPFLE
ncbi:MAG: polysaccharide biosynthesis tyrosine autokinase [Anaerolineae bacterium]|nr:polysaccharide biosynthesis tyrosine autokinase [Anaerolineae bacterium]